MERDEAEQLSLRQLREHCKKFGITCRGDKDQVLRRLQEHWTASTVADSETAVRPDAPVDPAVAPEAAEAEAHEDQHMQDDHRSGDKKRSRHGLTMCELHAQVLSSERPRQRPERFTPSPSEIVDDRDSCWSGISLDTDTQDLQQVSSSAEREQGKRAMPCSSPPVLVTSAEFSSSPDAPVDESEAFSCETDSEIEMSSFEKVQELQRASREAKRGGRMNSEPQQQLANDRTAASAQSSASAIGMESANAA